MIRVDAYTRAAIAGGRCAKIPTQKHPEEPPAISAGRLDFRLDGWSRSSRRVREGNWRAHLQWLAIRRAELANLPHVQPFPEPNQMPMKRSLPKAETNVLQFPQTARGRGHA